MEEKKRQAMYQVSTLQALVRGDYYGSADMATLLSHGDTGLGTFCAVAGELIVVDGKCYQVLGDGTAVEAKKTDTTPFATVTPLQQTKPLTFGPQPTIEALRQVLNKEIGRLGVNDIYAVRIDGHFNRVAARTELAQQEPYKPFAKVLETDERRFTFENLDGTLIGVYFPAYLNGVNTPGWHAHFISKDRTKGGHVFDLDLGKGQAIINKIDRFLLDMPHNKAFEQGDLSQASGQEIAQIEQGK